MLIGNVIVCLVLRFPTKENFQTIRPMAELLTEPSNPLLFIRPNDDLATDSAILEIIKLRLSPFDIAFFKVISILWSILLFHFLYLPKFAFNLKLYAKFSLKILYH